LTLQSGCSEFFTAPISSRIFGGSKLARMFTRGSDSPLDQSLNGQMFALYPAFSPFPLSAVMGFASPKLFTAFIPSSLCNFFQHRHFLFPGHNHPFPDFIGVPVAAPAKWLAVKPADGHAG